MKSQAVLKDLSFGELLNELVSHRPRRSFTGESMDPGYSVEGQRVTESQYPVMGDR